MTTTATISGFGGSRGGHIAWYAGTACLAFLLGGCARIFYEKTHIDKFVGPLDVERVAPNQFIYRPHPNKPLTYNVADGKVLRPQLMYTNGGSISRLFWSAPHLGLWDFALGFIIHNWLSLQHRCKSEDWQGFSFERSASVLTEALKRQLEQSNQPDPVVLRAIYEAVKTPTVKASRDSGDCRIPPGTNPLFALSAPGVPAFVPIRILSINIQ